jgi:hypothetical protein
MGCCKGAAKLVQAAVAAATSKGAASDEAVKARRDLCRECPEATRNLKYADHPSRGLSWLSRCGKCNCVIAAKTLLASESCPLGKWGESPRVAPDAGADGGKDHAEAHGQEPHAG